MESTLSELIKLIDEHGFVFWVCPKGCTGIVKWNESKTEATCMVCGVKSTDEYIIGEKRCSSEIHGIKKLAGYNTCPDCGHDLES